MAPRKTVGSAAQADEANQSDQTRAQASPAIDDTAQSSDASESLPPAKKASAAELSPEQQYETAITELIAALDPKEQKLLGARLFVEACLAFGVNPSPTVRPIEVLMGDGTRRWRFVEGSDIDGLPDRVVFVTAGGVKLSHPMDQDAQDRLLSIFGRKGVDAKGQPMDLPLPNDLTLPRPFVTGVPPRAPERAKVPVLREQAQRAVRGLK